MARLDQLRPAPGARRRPRRVGRGIGSGRGKTAGRGTKGQNARAGGGVRPGFEGGQWPLYRRVPKRGFTNARFRREYAEVNLDQLSRAFAPGEEVTPERLVAVGLVKDLKDGVKVLGRGTLDRALTVRAHRFSRAAVEKIAAAGGRAEVL
jgi:large subunit ribosomal protein L15